MNIQTKQMLRQIASKLENGLPLTPSEENLHAAVASNKYMRPRTTITEDADGNVTISESMHLDALFQSIKDFSAESTATTRSVTGNTYLGSVDTVTLSKWQKECGLPLHSVEFNAFVVARLSDSDYSKFSSGMQ